MFFFLPVGGGGVGAGFGGGVSQALCLFFRSMNSNVSGCPVVWQMDSLLRAFCNIEFRRCY